jgi:Tfp pilus assembly protein PilP
MKLTTGILAVLMMTGAAWAQNPDAIDNARSIAKSLQQKQTNETNAAGSPAKPAMGQPVPAKPAVVKPAPVPAAKSNPAPATAGVRPHDAFAPKKPAVAATKVAVSKPAAKAAVSATTKIAAEEKPAGASKSAEAPKPPKPEEKKWAMNGKRDPFFSPVVQQASGSGCSTGKKCLEIGQINLRGVVKAETGFIAVVTNSLNKAYFLHENDPVFNGYVIRITGDSVVFQETVQDKLGKPLRREVVKRIFTPAV